jgi:hypothetical protein
MKKYLFTTALAVSITTIVLGQQWVNFPTGSVTEWVNINDLDVPGDSITVEALVSVHDIVSANRDIISKHSGTLDCNYLFRPNLFGISTTAGFLNLANPVTLCQDTVYHLAATYDGSIAKYYVNGIAVDSQNWTGNLTVNNLNAGIGNRFAMLDEQFTGYIDELRIWNVARTASQIGANFYNLPNPTTQAGLLAYYKFNGNYNNIQGNAAWNGTPTGSLLSLSTNPYFYGAVPSSCSPVTGIFENSFSPAIQIFPNPFTSSATFTFNIESELQNLQLKIFDVIGREVSQRKLQIPETTLERGNLPSGIYFYRVTAEGKQIAAGKFAVE